MSSNIRRNMLRLSEAGKLVEAIVGETPHPSSLHRWATNGLKGIKLKTIYACGCRRTCHEWLIEFFEEVGGARPEGIMGSYPGTKRNSKGQSAADQANALLEAEGA